MGGRGVADTKVRTQSGGAELREAGSPAPHPPLALCRGTFLLWPRARGKSRSLAFPLSLLESNPAHSPHLAHQCAPPPHTRNSGGGASQAG